MCFVLFYRISAVSKDEKQSVSWAHSIIAFFFFGKNVAETFFLQIFECGKLQLQREWKCIDVKRRLKPSVICDVAIIGVQVEFCWTTASQIESLSLRTQHNYSHRRSNETMHRDNIDNCRCGKSVLFNFLIKILRRLHIFRPSQALLQLPSLLRVHFFCSRLCRFAIALKINIDLTPSSSFELFFPIPSPRLVWIKQQNCLPIEKS